MIADLRGPTESSVHAAALDRTALTQLSTTELARRLNATPITGQVAHHAVGVGNGSNATTRHGCRRKSWPTGADDQQTPTRYTTHTPSHLIQQVVCTPQRRRVAGSWRPATEAMCTL